MTIRVSGNPSASEVAAVLAALAGMARPVAEDPYRRWRDTRRAAVQHTTVHVDRPPQPR